MSLHDIDNPDFQCPYCGETISVEVDASAGERQSFVSDCEVCCKPINFKVRIHQDHETDSDSDDGSGYELTALREDELG